MCEKEKNEFIRVINVHKSYRVRLQLKGILSLLKIPFFWIKSFFSKSKPVLKGIDFSVPQGVRCGFLGKNGAGKSTTIKLLAHHIFPDKGDLNLVGYDVEKNYFRAFNEVFFQVEEPVFYNHLTGWENLKLIAILRDKSEREIEVALQEMGLWEDRNKRVGEYSTGMKQRLMLSFLSLLDTPFFILDEPTNGLDPLGQNQVRKMIMEKISEGKSLFISSHLLHEIEKICDWVIVIDEGKAVISGAVKELLAEKEERVDLKVDDLAKTEKILKKMNLRFEVLDEEENFLEVVTPLDYSGKLNKELVSNGVEVKELIVKKKDLEEFFLDVTKRE